MVRSGRGGILKKKLTPTRLYRVFILRVPIRQHKTVAACKCFVH